MAGFNYVGCGLANARNGKDRKCIQPTVRCVSRDSSGCQNLCAAAFKCPRERKCWSGGCSGQHCERSARCENSHPRGNKQAWREKIASDEWLPTAQSSADDCGPHCRRKLSGAADAANEGRDADNANRRENPSARLRNR